MSFEGIFSTVPWPRVPNEIFRTGVARFGPWGWIGGGGAGSTKSDEADADVEVDCAGELSPKADSSQRSSIDPTALRFFRRLRPFLSPRFGCSAGRRDFPDLEMSSVEASVSSVGSGLARPKLANRILSGCCGFSSGSGLVVVDFLPDCLVGTES